MAAPHALSAARAAPHASPPARRAASPPAAAAAAAAGSAAAAAPELTLWIGNKRYSSWSMRPWLYLAHHGLPFREELVPLGDAGARLAALGGVSPTGRVPVLLHVARGVAAWDSLAILEYLAGAPRALGGTQRVRAARPPTARRGRRVGRPGQRRSRADRSRVTALTRGRRAGCAPTETFPATCGCLL
jgi:hypothetical protein